MSASRICWSDCAEWRQLLLLSEALDIFELGMA
jgi:hypothetical protein